MGSAACGDLRFVEFVPTRFVLLPRIREAALRDQFVYDALTVMGMQLFPGQLKFWHAAAPQ